MRLFLKKYSLQIALLISLIILFFHFTLPRYKFYGFTKEFDWDILSYYLYLPLTFIQNDVGIKDYSYIQSIFDSYHFSPSFYQANQLPNGNWVMVYTSGVAILQLPFFLIGHIWAIVGGYPTNGFSFPYQFCVSLGNMIYIISGIFLIRKVLLNYFSEKIVSITLLMLFLGTNYFREATDYNMGPHGMLFTLYSLLLLSVVKWHNKPKIKYAITMGISIGFLILIRPTEIICILIPVFWNVYNTQTLKNKLNLIKLKWKHLFALLLTVFLIGLPQLIYWKYLTGSWIYNSYNNQISFDITESHLFNILFSFRKGWFIYTPIIICSFIGVFYLCKNYLIETKFAILLFVFCNIFILSHVPIWWNAGSFGQRFMVQSYALLAIPMAAFTKNVVFHPKIIFRILLTPILLLFIFLNLFQTWQFVRWIIPGDGITKEFYFRSLFKTQITEDDRSYLEIQRTYDESQKFDENNPKYKSKLISFFNMESLKNVDFIDSTSVALSGSKSFILSNKSTFSPDTKIPYWKITTKDHAWIKFSTSFFTTTKLNENEVVIVMVFSHKEKVYNYIEYPLTKYPYKINKWNTTSILYLTPAVFSEDDELKAYIWNKGSQTLLLDNIRVDAFDKK